jgi:hypothetical protein
MSEPWIEKQLADTNEWLAAQREAANKSKRDPRLDRLMELRKLGIPRDRATEMVDAEFKAHFG